MGSKKNGSLGPQVHAREQLICGSAVFAAGLKVVLTDRPRYSV